MVQKEKDASDGKAREAASEADRAMSEADQAGPAADDQTDQTDAAAPDGPSDDRDRVASLQAEVEDLRDRLARARADYQNLQRRVERDALLEKQRVKARFLEDFLQVYEYAQMAAFEAERNPGPLADGVKMVVREFDRLLEKEGVERLGKVGKPFDRDVHEAIATEAADGVDAGCVSRVVAPGYRLGDRVLRFAKVAVAPGADEEE